MREDLNKSKVFTIMSIRISMVLALMATWTAKIVDVKGAFLHGEFEEEDEPIYMGVPQGFETTMMMMLRYY